MEREILEQHAKHVVEAALEVHWHLGPGLLESAYEAALCYELSKRGVSFERQKALPIAYKEILLDCGFRADLVIADAILVELKSVESLTPIHEAQLLTYLRLTGKHLGFLINFNVRLLKHGLKRLVNDLPEAPDLHQ